MFVENISIKRNSCVGNTYNVNYMDIILLTIGRGSYIEKATVDSDITPNIHIGQFSTIKSNVTFRLPANNIFYRVTTSDDQHVAPLAGNVINDPHPINGQIIIQNDVWIGSNCTIKGGVIIRNGAIVMENSYVVDDVPPYSIVEGNPAKIVGYRFSDEQITAMQNIAWWNWSSEDIINSKPDFYLPLTDFLNKYKVPAPIVKSHCDAEKKRFLMFPDFGYPARLWKRIMEEYCERCAVNNAPGQLVIYVFEDQETEKNIQELQSVFDEYNVESADIVVQVGAPKNEIELFKSSDYLITTREANTVYYTCLADLYRVNILSGTDMPDVFGIV